MSYADEIRRLNIPKSETSFADEVRGTTQREKVEIQLNPNPKGLDDVGLRARMSLFGDTVEEKQRVFRQIYPLGDLKENSDGTLLFRKHFDEAYSPVDPSLKQVKEAGGSRLKEIAADVADLTGAAPQVAGDIITTLATRGAGPLARIGGYGASGALTEGMRQAGQSAAGTQTETGTQIAGEVGGAAASGVIGGALGEGIGAGVNVTRGAGALKLRPEQEEALRATQRLGAPTLTLGQLDVHPTITRLENQASSVLPRLKARYAEQQRFALDTINGLRSPADTALLRPRAIKAYDTARTDINNLLRKSLNVDPTAATKVGRQIQETAEDWWNNRSKQFVDSLYTSARQYGEPQFDFIPIQDVAQKIGRGTVAPHVIERDEAGRILPWSNIRVNELPADVKKVIDDIEAVDWNAPPERWTDSPMDVLRSFQQRLFDLTLPTAQGERSRTGVFAAREINKTIAKVLDNPVNASPGFTEAWKTARKAAAERFADREHSVMLKVLNSDTPSKLVNQIVTPGSVDSLKVLKRISDKESWNDLKASFVQRMLEDGVDKTIKSFDNETLRVLLNDFDLMEAQNAGRAFANLEASGVSKAIQAEHEALPLVRRLVDGDSGAVHELRNLAGRYTSQTPENLAKLNPNSPFRRSIRAAMVDDIIERVTKIYRGAETVTSTDIEKVLRKYEDSGAIKFLTNGDIQLLRDTALYNTYVRPPSDVGASLHGAAEARKLEQLKPSALLVYIHNNIIGRAVTNENVQKWLIGTGTKPKTYAAFLRMLATSATSVGADIAKDDARMRMEGAKGEK